MYAQPGQETGMKAICAHCGHDWLLPKGWTDRWHPPSAANRFMVAGCERCLGDETPSGQWWWRLEDGTEVGALTGVDELKEAGVAVLEHQRIRARMK